MRVLHILNELCFSGAETMLESAGNFFRANGLDSHILATTKERGNFSKNLEKSGYTVHHIPFNYSVRMVKLSAVFKFIALMNKYKFDVVHIHPERNYILYGILARLCGCHKIIRTVHHIFPPKSGLKGKVRKWIRTGDRWFFKKVMRGVIVSNSESGLANEIEHYQSKNLLYYNWFDSNKFIVDQTVDKKTMRKKLSLPEDPFLIVSLGGNWRYKNFHLIIEALAKLKGLEHVLYVQVGPDGEGVNLNEHAERYGVKEMVYLAGKVPEPLEYLQAADVYIMPSSLEGFGCAAAEAMGAGLPVILAHTPALKDFGRHCPDVEFVDTDPVDIAESILEFVKMSGEERREIGNNLSHIIHKFYSVEAGAGQFLRLYGHSK